MRRWLVGLALGLLLGPGMGLDGQDAGSAGVAPAGAGSNAAAKKSCAVKLAPPSEAELALSRREYAAALNLYGQMAATAADESRAGVIRVLIEQNKVDDALEKAEAWAQAEPASAAAEEALGEAQYRVASVSTALHTEQQVLRVDFCNARAHLMVGTIADLVGDHAKARDYYTTAHQLAPNDPEIRFAWIGTLPRARRMEEEAALLKEKNLLDPQQRERLQDGLDHAKNFKPDDCTLVTPVERATIPIREMMDGPQIAGPAGLDVEFNGKRRRLEIDTGASGIFLSRESAAGLHLVHEQETHSSGVGDKGEVATALAHVASIQVGGLEFRNCVVEVMEKKQAPYDRSDLIGADFFSRYLVTLDFPAMEMRLDPLPKRPEPEAAAAAAAGKAVAADAGDGEESLHDRYLAPEMRNWTKVFRADHQMLIPVSIGGTKDRLFLVDTGAFATTITPAAAREVTKVTKDSDMKIQGISGKVDEVYATHRMTVKFAQVTLRVGRMHSFDTTNVSHGTGVEVSGFLGEPVLYRGALRIDYRDNLIKFDYEELKDPQLYPNLLHYRSE